LLVRNLCLSSHFVYKLIKKRQCEGKQTHEAANIYQRQEKMGFYDVCTLSDNIVCYEIFSR